MYPIQSDVAYTEKRNRVTVLLRIFMMIPHMVVSYFWSIAVTFALFAQWFVIVFTGKRSQGIFDFIANYSRYSHNIASYGMLLHDKFPAFGPDDPASPARYEALYEEKASRLTTFFRYFMMLPAAFIATLYGIAMYFVVIISWFVIVITGRHPEGMWNFARKTLRLYNGVTGYFYLLTDKYPSPGVTMADPNFARPADPAPWKG